MANISIKLEELKNIQFEVAKCEIISNRIVYDLDGEDLMIAQFEIGLNANYKDFALTAHIIFPAISIRKTGTRYFDNFKRYDRPIFVIHDEDKKPNFKVIPSNFQWEKEEKEPVDFEEMHLPYLPDFTSAALEFINKAARLIPSYLANIIEGENGTGND